MKKEASVNDQFKTILPIPYENTEKEKFPPSHFHGSVESASGNKVTIKGTMGKTYIISKSHFFKYNQHVN